MQIPGLPARGWQRFVQRLAAVHPISALLSRVLPSLDRALLSLTGGKRTATEMLSGLPVVWLTSYGSTSGLPRVCPLVGIPDGERLVLVASNFGGKRHPSWYHNLRKNPASLIAFNGRTAAYTAYEAHGSERERLWSQAVRFYPGYRSYGLRAGQRRIPIMVLEPERGHAPKSVNQSI